MTKQQLFLRYILPFTLGIGAFAYIITKAYAVQVTCDEAYTLMLLTKESVWDLVSYKSSYTNNHILNTLLCKLSYSIFGMDQMAGRLPNILSFVLYFWFVWRFSMRFFKDNLVSLMFVTVMLGNPYMIEFFSLARGYGMSFGLMMPSIYYAARYVLEDDKKSLPISLAFAILSVYAQFALLHFYLGLNFLIFIFEIQKYVKSKGQEAISKGQLASDSTQDPQLTTHDLELTTRNAELLRGIGTLIIGVLVLGILVYAPFKAILKDNQIAYYGSKNIWDDSIVSLITRSLYGQGYLSGRTAIVFKNLMVLLFVFLIFNFIKNNNLLIKNNKLLIKNNELLLTNLQSTISNNQSKTDPSVFSFFLMLSVFFVITAQFYAFGTQYVVDRTCLFLYPIIALTMPTVATFIGQKAAWAKRSVAMLFIVFCVWHVSRTAQLTYFAEWWYDTQTLEVLREMKVEYQKMQVKRRIKLHTYWTFQPSFDYYYQEQHLDWMLEPIMWDNKVDTIKQYDYYYDINDEWDALKTHYDTMRVYDRGESLLLKRK
jgi:hypothetical protein